MQEISFQDRTANHFTAKSGKNAFLAVNWPLSHSLTILSVEPPLCRWHQSLLGFPRDRTKKKSLSRCPFVPGQWQEQKLRDKLLCQKLSKTFFFFILNFCTLFYLLSCVLSRDNEGMSVPLSCGTSNFKENFFLISKLF